MTPRPHGAAARSMWVFTLALYLGLCAAQTSRTPSRTATRTPTITQTATQSPTVAPSTGLGCYGGWSRPNGSSSCYRGFAVPQSVGWDGGDAVCRVQSGLASATLASARTAEEAALVLSGCGSSSPMPRYWIGLRWMEADSYDMYECGETPGRHGGYSVLHCPSYEVFYDPDHPLNNSCSGQCVNTGRLGADCLDTRRWTWASTGADNGFIANAINVWMPDRPNACDLRIDPGRHETYGPVESGDRVIEWDYSMPPSCVSAGNGGMRDEWCFLAQLSAVCCEMPALTRRGSVPSLTRSPTATWTASITPSPTGTASFTPSARAPCQPGWRGASGSAYCYKLVDWDWAVATAGEDWLAGNTRCREVAGTVNASLASYASREEESIVHDNCGAGNDDSVIYWTGRFTSKPGAFGGSPQQLWARDSESLFDRWHASAVVQGYSTTSEICMDRYCDDNIHWQEPFYRDFDAAGTPPSPLHDSEYWSAFLYRRHTVNDMRLCCEALRSDLAVRRGTPSRTLSPTPSRLPPRPPGQQCPIPSRATSGFGTHGWTRVFIPRTVPRARGASLTAVDWSGACRGFHIDDQAKAVVSITLPARVPLGGRLVVSTCSDYHDGDWDSTLWVGLGCGANASEFQCVAGNDDGCAVGSGSLVTVAPVTTRTLTALLGSYRGAGAGAVVTQVTWAYEPPSPSPRPTASAPPRAQLAFPYDLGEYAFVAVPPGALWATAHVWGAGGGGANGVHAYGGAGAYVNGTLLGLVPGESLRLTVGLGGQWPQITAGRRSQGGGGGGVPRRITGERMYGGGGGGFSGIERRTASGAWEFVAIAGGGGGGGGYDTAGGAGGLRRGRRGSDGAFQRAPVISSTGATAGGGAYQWLSGRGTYPGSNGSALQGGGGARGTRNQCGGGGGGYMGGAAGDDGGGGGGSSWVTGLMDPAGEESAGWQAPVGLPSLYAVGVARGGAPTAAGGSGRIVLVFPPGVVVQSATSASTTIVPSPASRTRSVKRKRQQ